MGQPRRSRLGIASALAEPSPATRGYAGTLLLYRNAAAIPERCCYAETLLLYRNAAAMPRRCCYAETLLWRRAVTGLRVQSSAIWSNRWVRMSA